LSRCAGWATAGSSACGYGAGHAQDIVIRQYQSAFFFVLSLPQREQFFSERNCSEAFQLWQLEGQLWAFGQLRGEDAVGGLRVVPRLRGACGFAFAAAMGLALAASFMPGLPGWGDRAAAQSMALPGKFGVGETGAATYEIPITVPPGTAGMVPSLSLSYNSQAGNGLLGMGWQLEGLPSLGRCPRTIAQDGVRGGVNYDANDRFCLDGQRLIAISGAYGADGTEYRTEIESFSKVVSRGTAGTGPAWFEVRTKTGQIMQFGNSADSRIIVQGKAEARSWAVNRVADTKGNFYSITYVNDAANAEAYPSRIDYTGNAVAGLVPYNSVRFVYTSDRSDKSTGYHAGSIIKSTVRMSKVQTFAGSTMVADYRLAYAQGTSTGRSQLTSVTLCDGAGSCLPATTFTWQNGTTNFTVTSNVGGQDGTLVNYRPYIADFNGDGVADVFWDSSDDGSRLSSSGNHVMWTNIGGGNFQVTTNWLGQNGTTVSTSPDNCSDSYNHWMPMLGDFNRDGRADVWWKVVRCSRSSSFPATKQWFSTNSGAHTVRDGPATPRFEWKDDVWRHYNGSLIEINGDGRQDVLWNRSSSLTQNVWITQPDGTVSSQTVNFPSDAILPEESEWSALLNRAFFLKNKGNLVDFNADNFSDFHFGRKDGFGFVGMWLGNGDNTFRVIAGSGDAGVDQYVPFYVDLNGDGQTDVVWDRESTSNLDYRSQGQRQAWLSKGDGTFVKSANLGGLDGTVTDGYRLYLGDFNGDGLPDILWDKEQERSNRSTGTRVLWLNRGENQFTVIPNVGGADGSLVDYVPLLADFNGDGKADILWDKRNGEDSRSKGTRVLWLSDGIVPDMLTSVTDGVGATASVTYKSLTDSGVYTRDTGAADPLIDLQGAMQVVARIDQSNGIGGQSRLTYAYVGGRAHQDGLGFLGFRQVRVTDPQTGIVQTTSYRQDHPFTGLVANETKTLGSLTLSSTTNAYDVTDLGGTRKQISLRQSQAESKDLDGSALPSVTSTYQYDTYGNATQITVASSDGYSKTTTNAYNNDTANWLLGRLATATVNSIAPAIEGQAPSEDTAPAPFDFVDIGDAAPSTLYETSVTLFGFNRPQQVVTVSGGNAQIRKNGGGDWGTSVSVNPSDKLDVRMASSPAYGAMATATVTIGGVSANWRIQTIRGVVIASNVNNFNLRTAHDALYPAPTGSESLPIKVVATIQPNVIVGSANIATPAFDVGNWPASIPVVLQVKGRIQGKGGNGGIGDDDFKKFPGQDGGAAFYAHSNITVDLSDGAGQIWGGGGGGGGGSGGSSAAGGGGGAGTLPGIGGLGDDGSTARKGQDGTSEVGGGSGADDDYGGTGGGPGLQGGTGNEGAVGGQPGPAILGSSFITQIGAGSIRGPVKADNVPNPFTFPAVTDANRGQRYETSSTVRAFAGTLTATISGNDAQIRKNGTGSWATSVSVAPGDTVNIRMTSSSSSNTRRTATVTVGSVSATWTIDTKESDTCSGGDSC
jgi:hypothetical protein